MAVAQIHHLGFQLAAIAQGQGDVVAHFGVAAHGAAQGHARLIVRFRFVDGVVVTHHDRVEVDAQLWWRDVHASIVGRGAGVASRIDDARIYLVVPFRQWGGHIHAVAAVRLYRSGQGLLVAVGIGHDQGNGTARRCIRRTGNGRGGVVGIVRRIDRDHWRSHIHATLVTRGAGVSCRIGDARIYLVVSFRQRDGHIHAVAAARLYRSDQGLLVAVDIGHDQGNGTARRGIRRTGNGRSGVVGVVWGINCYHWRCHIDASIVGRGAGVAGRIGDAGIYLVVPFRQWGGHIHAVAAVRLYRSGQGLLVAVGIGHDQGNGTARRGIRRTGNGRGGVVGVVRRINCYHWRSHINATIVGCCTCITS
ncbi:hypothetical protein VCSRO84_1031 [Vibrio cholerae]|nr:hypothetical protein VCSRO84_1031 [Vibrio cholerae]